MFIAGERCYDEGMFEAAKILFININNNAKLALCYVNLEQYREAVEAATKANSVSTWKEVCLACLKANEIRLANICGLHIIVHPDHLEDLIGHYERAGKSVELMQLLEQVLHSPAVIITTTYYLHYNYTCIMYVHHSPCDQIRPLDYNLTASVIARFITSPILSKFIMKNYFFLCFSSLNMFYITFLFSCESPFLTFLALLLLVLLD